MQVKDYRYTFKPTIFGVLITIICIPLFIKLGYWQYGKAVQKQAIQTAYNQAKIGDALKLPASTINMVDTALDVWKYKKVIVSGVYVPKYQFLLDNQVEGNRVGYHVITPLKIAQSNEYILINRGWILAKDTHTDVPTFNTPIGLQVVVGQVWIPSKKIFTLEAKATAESTVASKARMLEAVWQNMNMAKYQANVPFNISPMVIRLDKESPAGGFVRNWQVAPERIATNMGYAFQWFGFAFATLLIFIYMSISRVDLESKLK